MNKDRESHKLSEVRFGTQLGGSCFILYSMFIFPFLICVEEAYYCIPKRLVTSRKVANSNLHDLQSWTPGGPNLGAVPRYSQILPSSVWAVVLGINLLDVHPEPLPLLTDDLATTKNQRNRRRSSALMAENLRKSLSMAVMVDSSVGTCISVYIIYMRVFVWLLNDYTIYIYTYFLCYRFS